MGLKQYLVKMRDLFMTIITRANAALSNRKGEGNPSEIIRDLAKLFLPSIMKMVETEEGMKQLKEWSEDLKRKKEEEKGSA